jgi:hypothetical protein
LNEEERMVQGKARMGHVRGGLANRRVARGGSFRRGQKE